MRVSFKSKISKRESLFMDLGIDRIRVSCRLRYLRRRNPKMTSGKPSSSARSMSSTLNNFESAMKEEKSAFPKKKANRA